MAQTRYINSLGGLIRRIINLILSNLIGQFELGMVELLFLMLKILLLDKIREHGIPTAFCEIKLYYASLKMSSYKKD